MILIVCAVAKELSFFAPLPHVELLVTGVGPIEAGNQVSRALAMGRYDLVINAGVAGAMPGFAQVGEGVVVTDELFELDLETDEPLSLPGGLQVHDRVAGDLVLTDRIAELGFRALRGVTVARVTATDETAGRLAALGAQVESMEGFAVLRAAEIAGVPAIEVRGISNRVGDRAKSGWDFSGGLAGLERIMTALLPVVISTHG